MLKSRGGYTVSLVVILIIILAACVAFYTTHDSSNQTVNFSPEDNDGVHLECSNICGIIAEERICYPRCQYVFGEGPDLCDPIGSVCLMP